MRVLPAPEQSGRKDRTGLGVSGTGSVDGVHQVMEISDSIRPVCSDADLILESAIGVCSFYQATTG